MHASAQERFASLVEGGGLPLPLLPEVAIQVSRVVERPDCDARTVAELLHRDPAIAAHVLRVVSTPMFAGSTKIVSLQQAIVRLGFSAVAQIALTVAAKSRVFAVADFGDDVRAIFTHSVATALFAQEIARRRRSAVDLAFLAGLLHEIGRPIALQALVDIHRELGLPLERAGIMVAAETVHAAVGAALIARWGLPERLGEAVRRHHDPAGHELALTVALADRLARGEDGGVFAPALNLYPEDVDAIAGKAGLIAETALQVAA